MHNQVRQYDLALKKKWVTLDGWFCLFTTIFGIFLVDCWKIEKTRCSIIQKKSKTLLEYVNQLGQEMIDAATIIEESGKKKMHRGREFYINTIKSNTSSGLSSLSGNIGTRRRTRYYLSHQSRYICCVKVDLFERKTRMKRSERGKGFCRDNSGRNCWSLPVAYGGVPCAPIRGTKKRKANEKILKQRDEASITLHKSKGEVKPPVKGEDG